MRVPGVWTALALIWAECDGQAPPVVPALPGCEHAAQGLLWAARGCLRAPMRWGSGTGEGAGHGDAAQRLC